MLKLCGITLNNNSRIFMKHSFRRRLNFFFGCIGFAAVCLATWYGILWHIGNQKNMADKAALLADACITTDSVVSEVIADGVHIPPATYMRFEHIEPISTGKRPVVHSAKAKAKQPTAAEKEAAAQRWREKKAAMEAAKVAAVEQPVKAAKAKSKTRNTKPKPTGTNKQTPQFVVTKVKPPTAKEIEEQKLWLIMKQETAAVMGGRKEPTPAKAKPVQNMRILELMAGKW